MAQQSIVGVRYTNVIQLVALGVSDLKLVEMVILPRHAVGDGAMKVPKRIDCGYLNSSPHRGRDPSQRNLELLEPRLGLLGRPFLGDLDVGEGNHNLTFFPKRTLYAVSYFSLSFSCVSTGRRDETIGAAIIPEIGTLDPQRNGIRLHPRQVVFVQLPFPFR